jgi:DNA repair photolyase
MENDIKESNKKSYQAAVGLRGDCLYCPLSLTVDAYWNCLTECHHCYMRRLNRTWGMDLRPSDPDDIYRKLYNGLNNKNPKSSLAWAIHLKKTIRFGNKSDAFQDADNEYIISKRILKVFNKLKWSYVIQTHFLHNMIKYDDIIYKSAKAGNVVIMPVISPGGSKDWDILERQRTTPLDMRIAIIKRLLKDGIPLGVNGEPFIPGYHTIKQFEDTIKLLKSIGVKSYNTYNFHFNDWVAKQLHSIGIDIEKIWYMNQDKEWKKILVQLLEISKKYDILLGVPDFVNTGWEWKEKANTCCGINVPNPTTFNTHYFKKLTQRGLSTKRVIKKTWENIGNKLDGESIILGTTKKMYTLKDIK